MYDEGKLNDDHGRNGDGRPPAPGVGQAGLPGASHRRSFGAAPGLRADGDELFFLDEPTPPGGPGAEEPTPPLPQIRIRSEGPPTRTAGGPTLEPGRACWIRHDDPRGHARPGDPAVVVWQGVYRAVSDHLAADTSREHGGVLLGHVVTDPGGKATVYVLAAIPGRYTEGTPTRLTFTFETQEDIAQATEALNAHGLGLRQVGWYHSHPNLPIFLSAYDLDVCSLYRQPWHLALVVDPIRDHGAFFTRGDEGYHPQCPVGFWELCELSTESVVTWKNLRATRTGLDETPVDPEPEPEPHPDPVDEPTAAAAPAGRAFPRGPLRHVRQHATTASLAVLAVALVGGLVSVNAELRAQRARVDELAREVHASRQAPRVQPARPSPDAGAVRGPDRPVPPRQAPRVVLDRLDALEAVLRSELAGVGRELDRLGRQVADDTRRAAPPAGTPSPALGRATFAAPDPFPAGPRLPAWVLRLLPR